MVPTLLLPVLAFSGSAAAYVINPCLDRTSALPSFTLDEVPAGTVFAAATTRAVDCDELGGTLSLTLTADADGTATLDASEPFEGPAGLLLAAPEAPLEVGAAYTFRFGGGAEHPVTATDDPVPTPDGAPAFLSLQATATAAGPVSLEATLTPVDYPEGLSLLGVESSDGRLLTISEGESLVGGDPAPTDGCYTPIQVFADGSTARGEAECPEVAPAPLCATATGAPGLAAVALAMAAGVAVGRRPRRTAGRLDPER